VRHDRPGPHWPVVGLLLSALALGIAPMMMPASYSWLAHTTSESAAQGVPGAWLARGGFLVFGGTVVTIASAARDRWGRPGVDLHAAFGVLMIATGLFSSRSWDRQAPFAALEDLLHSIAATSMGFAFAFGVAAVALARWRARRAWRLIDLTAVLAAVALPLAMAGSTGFTGVFQRAMFLVAYAWYGLETLGTRRPRPAGAEPGR
jgi:hypothetical protein